MLRQLISSVPNRRAAQYQSSRPGGFKQPQHRGIFFLAFPPLIIGGIVIMGLGGIAMSAYNKRQRQLYQENLAKEKSTNSINSNDTKNDHDNSNNSTASSGNPKQQ